jgi:hypothetical protein
MLRKPSALSTMSTGRVFVVGEVFRSAKSNPQYESVAFGRKSEWKIIAKVLVSDRAP